MTAVLAQVHEVSCGGARGVRTVLGLEGTSMTKRPAKSPRGSQDNGAARRGRVYSKRHRARTCAVRLIERAGCGLRVAVKSGARCLPSVVST